MKLFNTVYKIYIDDGYMGSGTHIRNAVINILWNILNARSKTPGYQLFEGIYE